MPSLSQAARDRNCAGNLLRAPVLPRALHVLSEYCIMPKQQRFAPTLHCFIPTWHPCIPTRHRFMTALKHRSASFHASAASLHANAGTVVGTGTFARPVTRPLAIELALEISAGLRYCPVHYLSEYCIMPKLQRFTPTLQRFIPMWHPCIPTRHRFMTALKRLSASFHASAVSLHANAGTVVVIGTFARPVNQALCKCLK